MIAAIGRGLSSPFIRRGVMTFRTTSALSPLFTFTRSDTVSTYRDKTGKLKVAASNAPRFDHDINGNVLGLLIEGSIQNKLTVYNANPTATTNWTKGGDAGSIFSVVDDPSSYLAGAKIEDVCTGGKLYKLDNAAGTTDAYVESAATFGSTSVHTISAWIVALNGSGTGAKLTRSGTSPTAFDIGVGTSLKRQEYALTPNATTDKMRILAPAGKVVYFILPQMELNPFASSVIITAGAAATRQQDICYMDNLDSKRWWKSGSGALTIRYIPTADISTTEYMVCATDGANFNEAVGLRIDSSGYDLKADVKAGNVSLASGDSGTRHTAGRLTFAGISWKSGESKIIGQGDYDDRTFTGAPGTMTRLNIGARNGGSSRLWGWIQEVRISKKHMSAAALGAMARKAGDTIILLGGQSLSIGHFYSQSTLLDTGRQKFIDTIGAVRPQDAVTLVSGGTGSSAAAKTSNGTNYWWDLATSTRGPAFDTLYASYASNGVAPTLIIWAQGEEDSSQIPALTSRAQYKAALLAIFTDMRATFGPVPIFIQKIGRRDTFTNPGGVQVIREVQAELAAEYDWIYEAAEIYDVDLVDGLHPTATGYGTIAERASRKILQYLGESVTGVDGPRITGASRSGTTVTVTVTHDGGTDFTPTTGIKGFTFFDGGSEIAVNAAVRTNATTITLTLASTPTAGTKTLYYLYDAETSLDKTKVVKDNSAYAMPLKPVTITVS